MKKNILLIIIIIIFSVAIFLFLQKSGFFTEKNIIQEEFDEKENSLSFSIIPINQTDSFYNIKAEYPQFKNASNDFNKKISDLINNKIDNFKKEAKDNWEARKATAMPDDPVSDNPTEPFDFICTWKPVQNNSQYLSFVVNLYYFVGGAHGANEIYAFNYDLDAQKEISIFEFLNSSQESFEKMSELAEKEVVLKLQSKEIIADDFIDKMIKNGTKAIPENYKNFNFNRDSLIIYFQQYQVAPGSAGEITITFYKNNLEQNLIKSDYLK